MNPGILTMGDWAGLSEAEVWDKLAEEWGGWDDRENVERDRPNFQILAAYEQQNDYDGLAYLLLRHSASGELYEVESSHCSCYGHTWDTPSRVTAEYLKRRVSDGKAYSMPFGTYYESDKEGAQAFRALVEAL